MVIRTVRTNGRATATGPFMATMVKRFHQDMLPFAFHDAESVFFILARIPFKPDPVAYEMLQRPALTLSMSGPGGDCDDKAIAMGSWAYLNKIPFRFVAVRRSNRKTLHHVFTELYIRNRWVPFDCTFSYNLPGRTPHYQERVIIWPTKHQIQRQ